MWVAEASDGVVWVADRRQGLELGIDLVIFEAAKLRRFFFLNQSSSLDNLKNLGKRQKERKERRLNYFWKNKVYRAGWYAVHIELKKP